MSRNHQGLTQTFRPEESACRRHFISLGFPSARLMGAVPGLGCLMENDAIAA